MAFHGDKYFDGYQRVPEKDAKGNIRYKLKYMDQWYGYEEPGRLRRVKGLSAALTAVMLAAYLFAQLHPAVLGMIRIMAIPSLFALVPMIFMVMGLLNLLLAKEKWELHTCRAGYRRLLHASVPTAVLLGVWVVMAVVLAGVNRLLTIQDILYLICACISLAAQLCLIAVLRKNPPVVVEGPVIR